MKTLASALALVLLAACSSPSGDTNAPETAADPTVPADSNTPTPATTPAGSMTMPEAPATSATTATASGTIEAVDVAAKTITIAHGPVDALKWPAMTMTFKAPNADLKSVKKGDQVTFEFVSSGMDATIVTINRR